LFFYKLVLHIASRLGYFDQVEQLLNAGASANVRDAQGWIPLHSCCANFTPNTLAICKALLITGKTQAEVPTNSGTTPLHYLSRCTVSQGQFGLLNEVIDLMLLHGNYIDSQTKFGETPLHQASLHGNLETIRLLIEKGAKCNARTKYAFFLLLM
jgi:ankyrin repeat protein